MYDAEIVNALPADEKLPHPKGYKILILVPKASEKTEGGLYIPDDLKDRESTASILGFVVRTGPDAYKDKDRFSEPWCKEGDWIIFRSYSGTRFTVDGTEMRLINDDTVDAVVPDPKGYKRA